MISETDDFREAGAKLQAGERKIVLGVRRELRAAGKPVGQAVSDAIGNAMPARGGLRARLLSQTRVNLLVDMRKGVSIKLATAGMFMSQFEKGTIRHPPPGGRGPWIAQSVPAGKGGQEFVRHADELRGRIMTAMRAAVS